MADATSDRPDPPVDGVALPIAPDATMTRLSLARTPLGAAAAARHAGDGPLAVLVVTILPADAAPAP